MSDTINESTPSAGEAPLPRTSRRSFLGTAAGLTGVALATGAWRPAAGPSEAAATRSSFAVGNFALELDGTSAGFLKSVDGGSIYADVVETTGTPAAKKHIGSPKYEDFSLQVGFSMSKAVYDWIDSTWTGNFMRKNGAVLAADLNRVVKSSRTFQEALLTETTIPACDGSAKDPAYLTLGFAPERIQASKKIGQTLTAAKQQKAWLSSNFRLKIDNLDCTKVSKIDAFTIKQSVSESGIGETREPQKEPGKLEFPNLKLTLAETSASTWNLWFEDFVINGNNGDVDERNGTLEFLSPNGTEVFAHVAFFNLGIYRLGPTPHMSGADTIPRVEAELYCERMRFKLGPPPPVVITSAPGGP